jgi:hypothetical protein
MRDSPATQKTPRGWAGNLHVGFIGPRHGRKRMCGAPLQPQPARLRVPSCAGEMKGQSATDHRRGLESSPDCQELCTNARARHRTPERGAMIQVQRQRVAEMHLTLRDGP